jgi:hypothetical protein
LDKSRLVCATCEHEFDIQHDVCRACGQLNKSDAATCAHCQAALARDTVDEIIGARIKTEDQWKEDRLEMVREQKRQEEEASQRRMEAFWAEEKARKEAIARRMAEQEEREKKTMTVVGIVAAVIVVALAAAAIIIAVM